MKKSTKIILIVAGIVLIGGGLTYWFVIKPRMEAKKKKAVNSNNAGAPTEAAPTPEMSGGPSVTQ